MAADPSLLVMIPGSTGGVDALTEVLGISAYEAKQRVGRQGMRVLRTSTDAEALAVTAAALREKGLDVRVIEGSELMAMGSARRAFSVAETESGMALLAQNGTPLVEIDAGTDLRLVAGDLQGEPTDMKLHRPMETQARLLHIGVNRDPALRIFAGDQDVLVLGRGFNYSGLKEGLTPTASRNFALLVNKLTACSDRAVLDTTWLQSDPVHIRTPSVPEPEVENLPEFEAHARAWAAIWRTGSLSAEPAASGEEEAEADTIQEPAPAAEPVWLVCGRCDLRYRFQPGASCPRCASGWEPDLGDALGGSLIPWIAGGIAALIGAAAWVAVLATTGYELGYLAWGIGGFIGVVVAVAKPRRAQGGIAAGTCAAVSLLVAKFASVLVAGIPVSDLLSAYDLLWFGLAIVTAAGLADRDATE